MKISLKFFVLCSLLWTLEATAKHPECFSNGQKLPINNLEVMSQKNHPGHRGRAHLKGTVVRMLPCAPQISTLEMTLEGLPESEKVSVYISPDFDAPKDIRRGDKLETCGNFVVMSEQRRLNIQRWNDVQCVGEEIFPNAIITHWTHISHSSNQESGYVLVQE